MCGANIKFWSDDYLAKQRMRKNEAPPLYRSPNVGSGAMKNNTLFESYGQAPSQFHAPGIVIYPLTWDSVHGGLLLISRLNVDQRQLAQSGGIFHAI